MPPAVVSSNTGPRAAWRSNPEWFSSNLPPPLICISLGFATQDGFLCELQNNLKAMNKNSE